MEKQFKLSEKFFLKKKIGDFDEIKTVGVEFLITHEDGTYINNTCFDQDTFKYLLSLDSFKGGADNFYLFEIYEQPIKQPILFVPIYATDHIVQNNDILFYEEKKNVLKYIDKAELNLLRKKYRKILKILESSMLQRCWLCPTCGFDDYYMKELINNPEGSDNNFAFRVCKYCGSIHGTNI